MASLTDLPGTAEKLLAAFVAQLEAQDVELPERRYRAPGSMIVWDGEQMTVALMGIDQGQPGVVIAQSMVASALSLSAQFSINLVRQVTGLQADKPFSASIPDEDVMDGDGVVMLGDAAALIRAASEIHAQDSNTGGKAFGVISPGESFVIGPLQPLGPEGGLAGTRLLISLSVD